MAYLSRHWRWSVHVPYWLSASRTRVSVSLASPVLLEKHCFSWSCRGRHEQGGGAQERCQDAMAGGQGHSSFLPLPATLLGEPRQHLSWPVPDVSGCRANQGESGEVLYFPLPSHSRMARPNSSPSSKPTMHLSARVAAAPTGH